MATAAAGVRERPDAADPVRGPGGSLLLRQDAAGQGHRAVHGPAPWPGCEALHPTGVWPETCNPGRQLLSPPAEWWPVFAGWAV